MSQTAAPKGSTILVTGVTGFIGSHVASEFIKNGFKVRGSVRDATKASWISEYFRKHYPEDAFETVVVPDMSVKGCWVEPLKGCAGLAHVASDLGFGYDPNEVVTPVVNATKDLLETAAATPGFKRFVYCSSSAATHLAAHGRHFDIDDKVWNDEDVKIAWAPPPYTPDRAFAVYAASKAEAERACFDFVKEKKPNFVLNCVLPNWTVGAILHPKQHGASASVIKKVGEGDESSVNLLRDFPPQWMSNVRDVALLHVAGAALESVQNERLFVFAESFNFNDWLRGIRKARPDLTTCPADDPKQLPHTSTVKQEQSEKALKELVGRGHLIGLDESVKELFDSVEHWSEYEYDPSTLKSKLM